MSSDVYTHSLNRLAIWRAFFIFSSPVKGGIEMAHMPEKDPGLWATALAWLVAHQPQLSTGGTQAVLALTP